MRRFRIWGMGTCSVDLEEAYQEPIILDKCRYALLNETEIKYRLSELFFFRDMRKIEMWFQRRSFSQCSFSLWEALITALAA